MAAYSAAELELATNIGNANVMKESVVFALVRDGYLTEEQGKEICESYSIVIVRKGMLGSMIDKLIKWVKGEESSDWQVRVVKLV